MFWDSRVRSLETQALEPIKALEEMRGHAYPEAAAVDTVVARIRNVPEYVALFQDAFGSRHGGRWATASGKRSRPLNARSWP